MDMGLEPETPKEQPQNKNEIRKLDFDKTINNVWVYIEDGKVHAVDGGFAMAFPINFATKKLGPASVRSGRHIPDASFNRLIEAAKQGLTEWLAQQDSERQNRIQAQTEENERRRFRTSGDD